MKIIAERYDGFIVDISKSDLEKLTGFYYGKHTFKIGEQITISKLFYQLNTLNTQEKEIKEIAHKLKTAAGMLEKIDPIFFEEK